MKRCSKCFPRWVRKGAPSTIGAALFAGSLFLGSTWARADQALVVGVNRYSSLKGANLRGCVNDANTMARSLAKYGFAVKTLTNQQATKRNIMATLAEMRRTASPSQRFTFYFAGHGSQDVELQSVLLPSDASEGSDKNDIKPEDLNRAVRAIPARSRTILLDSCFSGGMVRGLRAKGLTMRTRFHRRDLVLKQRIKYPNVPVNNADTNDDLTQGSQGAVCYFTATHRNEQAGEDDFGLTPHGIFTYFLSQRLNGTRRAWGQVQAEVSGKVAEHMDDLQHPTLFPTSFAARPMFEGPTVSPQTSMTPPAPTFRPTLWDIYNSDRVDRSKVEVRMIPDKSSAFVGENLSFTTRVGFPGYLVILERGVSGKINCLFPNSNNARDAFVRAGVSIPAEGFAYAPDAPGTERLRAILFTSKEGANALLRQVFGKDLQLVQLKNRPASSLNAPFFTSDLLFEVLPQPRPGGRR